MRAGVVAIAAALLVQSPLALDTLLERLHQYLLDYEPLISQVIADEEMHQRSRTSGLVISASGESQRRLTSEVAFMRLPGDGAWIGYRAVQAINGRPVAAQRERLYTLLTRHRRRAATRRRDRAREREP